MSVLLGWVIFIVAMTVSVMLHEFGHFATAKKFGMKATQFFLGFGPTLWSYQRGETEYGVKAIPGGGFVKIVGMTSMDEVDEEDEPRSFRVKPGWQRVIVLVAGSFMHFLLAFVLLLVVPLAVGIENTNSTTIGLVVSCVPVVNTATSANPATCPKGEPTSPAKQIGLRPGDKIVAFGGTPVHTWDQFDSVIHRHRAGSAVTVTIQRGSTTFSKVITLAKTKVSGKEDAFLGVAAADLYTRSGPLRAVTYAGSMFGQAVTGTVDVVRTLPGAVTHLFAKNRADTSAGDVTSVVGVGEITGQVVSDSSLGWQSKASLVLLIIISVNIFIGLLNLLPLLPLDGGHVAAVLYERVRAWLARLRGRPDPGLVDMTKLIPVSLGVFAILIGFSLLLILADIVNPINILQ
jgi:membrane-associated protease RseP (regulator of RpoE activity)